MKGSPGTLAAAFVAVVLLALAADYGGVDMDAFGGIVGRSSDEGAPAEDVARSSAGSVGIGALFGALLGAVATHLLGRRREEAQSYREMAGLGTLVGNEVEINTNAVKTRRDEPRVTSWAELTALYLKSPPTFDAWEDARVTMSRLMEPKDFAQVAEFYRRLRNYMNLVDAPRSSIDEATLNMVALEDDLVGEGENIVEILLKYTGPVFDPSDSA